MGTTRRAGLSRNQFRELLSHLPSATQGGYSQPWPPPTLRDFERHRTCVPRRTRLSV